MFRMLKLDPPNGWRAVVWELAIVTLGVLIALAAQQWVEERSWRAKVSQSKAAIREELAKHYSWSVEWRVVAPCILTQIDGLQQRIERSGDRLDPAPSYSDEVISKFVLRMPSKDYADGAWQGAISDGVASRFDPKLRSVLNDHYMQAATVQDESVRNTEEFTSLQSLKRAIPLDPMVRYTLLERLDALRGRADFMDLQSGQIIGHIQKVGMVPDVARAKRDVERFGTYKFCKAQGLPMRSFTDAMRAVPN
ncbi:MAG: hypothetical protein LH485_04450 [Sphingomonas bacterium]|nr:hypothetical protein [Sphingomonas bacterium]